MIRISAFQSFPKTSFYERKVQIVEALEAADRKRIDFLCFPEGFLTGYYVEKEEAEQNSLDIASSAFQEWLQELRSFRVTAIVGFTEKFENHIYDSAAIIENGSLLGIQRKHYLYHQYFTSGNYFSVYKSKNISFGVIICLDANYFEPSRLLALQGASIIFCPMCNVVPLDHSFVKKPAYYSHFIARSHENRSWIVAADWIWPNNGKSFCPGHSCIYDSDGKEIVRSRAGEEEFIYADISRESLNKEKGRRVTGSSILFEQIVRLNGKV